MYFLELLGFVYNYSHTSSVFSRKRTNFVALKKIINDFQTYTFSFSVDFRPYF